MGKYVLKRVVLAFVTAFIILSLTFILVKLLPFERPIGGDQQQIAYFDKQYNLGYVYRFKLIKDAPIVSEYNAMYGEYLYRSPIERGSCFYYYKAPVLEQYGSWIKTW